MAYSKKPMSENEKKAKMTALKGAHSAATDAMKGNLYKKDTPEQKAHVKSMSKESGIDFKGDSDKVVDPTHYGNVVGRHISDENIDCQPNSSTYNLDELEARVRELMEMKNKYSKGK